jgi:hypothetical protein
VGEGIRNNEVGKVNRRNKVRLLLVAIAVIGAIAFWLAWKGPGSGFLAETQRRIARLRAEVEEQRGAAERVVANYQPTSRGRIDDLQAPVEPLLRQLPGVVHVDTPVAVERPSARIIHLRDWHYVPRDLYAAEERAVHRRELIEQEVDAVHEQHLLQVELIQLEQAALLRCLARHHALRRMFIEGMTAKEVPHLPAHIADLRAAQKQLGELHTELTEARQLLAGIAGREGTTRHQQALAGERELLGLFQERRIFVLSSGAAAQLFAAGELEGVLPLDDAELLDAAGPVIQQGRVQFDRDKVRMREDAHVRTLVKSAPVALLVAGGAHDLSGSVKRLGGGTVEYVRVTTRRYVQFEGEDSHGGRKP